MDCLVLPARPSRKEPAGRLERWSRRKCRAVQGGRYARGVSAARGHLLLDDRDLAQEGRRGRSGGAGAKKARAETGWIGTTNPKVGARQRSSAPQARARRIDHRRPKKTVRY